MKPVASRKILIDTDTASDDAVALIMALRSPEVEVLAITTVGGNVPVDQATQNALYTAELCASTVPIFSGAATPLIRPLEDAIWFHGRDGLGDQGYRPVTRTAESGFAVDAMVRIVEANPGIELITLGPLTNLALAIQQWPQLAANVSRCVVMGGAPCCEGNVTPAGEYNFWVDPEAARVVLRSQLPIELVGWQLSRGAAVVNGGEKKRFWRCAPPSQNSPSNRTGLPPRLITPKPGKRVSPFLTLRRWQFCSIPRWRSYPHRTTWMSRSIAASRVG